MIVVTGIKCVEVPSNPYVMSHLRNAKLPVLAYGDMVADKEEMIEYETVFGEQFFRVVDEKLSSHEIAFTGEIDEFFRWPFEALRNANKNIEELRQERTKLKLERTRAVHDAKNAKHALTDFKHSVNMMPFLERLKFLFGGKIDD